MNDELFDCDDANILHLAEHEVSPEEAEEVLLGETLDLGFERSAWVKAGGLTSARPLMAECFRLSSPCGATGFA